LSSSDPWSDPGYLDGIASSGSGCHGSGRVGGPVSSSCSPRPFWRGTAEASGFTGRWKSRPNPGGRPKLDAELRHLIHRIARDNPTWGRRRIRAELALLGYAVAELTVAKYMRRRTTSCPSPTWRAFLHAHLHETVAVDFFLVSTLPSACCFVFVVLRHERRELLHVNVTDHPTAAWAARQLIEAFPDDSAPRFLLRDRDAIYGEAFARRVKSMGIREVLTAPRAPWQNPLVERVIGSIRRECLDQILILNDAHLRRLLRSYVAYYNHASWCPTSLCA
jgi:transposase InsO family protein